MIDDARLYSILHNATQAFGRSFEQITFHAFDDNHMPVGSPLTPQEYALWLVHTYENTDEKTLRSISAQYDAAILSAQQSPGILPDALANLILSGEVFRALISPSNVQTAQPVPQINKIPRPDPSTSGQITSGAKTTTQPPLEDRASLERMRAEIMRELQIDTPLHNSEELQNIVTSLVEKRTQELQQLPQIDAESRAQKIQTYHTTLSQRAIALQSINIRLGESPVTRSEIPTSLQPINMPTPTNLEQLRENIQTLIKESEKIEHSIENTTQNSQRIHHMKTQIQIIEQLLQMLHEETVE